MCSQEYAERLVSHTANRKVVMAIPWNFARSISSATDDSETLFNVAHEYYVGTLVEETYLNQNDTVDITMVCTTGNISKGTAVELNRFKWFREWQSDLPGITTATNDVVLDTSNNVGKVFPLVMFNTLSVNKSNLTGLCSLVFTGWKVLVEV